MRKTVLLPLFVISLSVITLAQDRALITGDAEDASDTPLQGVKITLRNDSLRLERTTTTNGDGFYFFANVVPAEDYTIVAESPGVEFAPKTVKFNVQVGENRHLLPSFIAGKPPATSDLRRSWPNVYKMAPVSLSSEEHSVTSPKGAASFMRFAVGSNRLESPGGGQGQNATSPTGQGTSPSQSAQATNSPGAKKRADTAAEVDSSPVPLDTITNAVSTVITANQLRTLPLYNRNFLALGLLVANTHDVPAGSELKDTTFSISGERPTSNAFLLDGMDNRAASSNQAIPFQVNDAIQEFRVTSAGTDAQFGRNMGGVVNVVTQRGTAQFHGSIFGFFGSDALNAGLPVSVYGGSGFMQAAAFAGSPNAAPAANTNPRGAAIYEPNTYNQYVATVEALNQQDGTSFCTVPGATHGTPGCNPRFDPAAILAQHNNFTQPFSSQQFGAQAGGSLAKRWFWFADYEGTRIDNPTPIFERVPSSYDRSHLSEFDSSSSGYPDAKFAQSVLSLFPQSNVVAIPGVLEFYQGQAPNYTDVNNYLARLDFNQSANSDWSVRYNLQRLGQLHDDTLPSSANYPGNGAMRNAQNQNAVLTYTHYSASGVSNVIRGGFTQFRVNETPQDGNFNAAQIGLPAGPMYTYLLSGLDPQYAGASARVPGAVGGWYDSIWSGYNAGPTPLISPSLDGLFPFARIGAPLSAPSERRDSEWQLMDNVSLLRGRHSLRLGIEYQGLQDYFSDLGFSRGFMVSNDIGEFTTDSATCNLCRHPQIAFTDPGFDYALKSQGYQSTFHSFVIGGYAQDTWRVKPDLVLNLGLRYEYFSPPNEVNGQIWNYDPVANGLVQQGSTQVLNNFGVSCDAVQTGPRNSVLSSIYFAGAYVVPWDCKTAGNGNFVQTSLTNFEPRVGFIWSTPSGNTVIRAGFGIFYDQMPASDVAQLMFNRPIPFSRRNPTPQGIYSQNYLTSFCGFAQCSLGNTALLGVPQSQLSNQAASLPFALTALDPQHHDNMYTRQVTLSLERQFTKRVSGEAGYIGNYMGNLPVKTNTGFNNEWFCTASAANNGGDSCDGFSYLPVFTLTNQGYGNYNAFYLKATTRDWHGFQARASYTYSKALDNGSGGGPTLIPVPLRTNLAALQYKGIANPTIYGLGVSTSGRFVGRFAPGAISANVAGLSGLLTQGLTTTGVGQLQVTPYTIPQDPYNFLQNDYGRSDYDQTNRFIFEYSWAIPHRESSVLWSGWNLSGILVAQSGQPFTVFSSVAGEFTERVSLTGPLSMTGNPNQYIGNTSAIVLPGVACQQVGGAHSPYAIQQQQGLWGGVAGTPCLGDSGRNQFTGPAYVDFDMAIQKTFKITEKIALLFRVESYNLFNRANYYNPISTYSLDGVTPYSQFGQIQSAHNPRQFQFAVRMNW